MESYMLVAKLTRVIFTLSMEVLVGINLALLLKTTGKKENNLLDVAKPDSQKIDSRFIATSFAL